MKLDTPTSTSKIDCVRFHVSVLFEFLVFSCFCISAPHLLPFAQRVAKNSGYKFTCGILLCRRGEVLSTPRVLVLKKVSRFHLVHWMSSMVRSCLFVLFGFFLLFFCFGAGHPIFCIFTCSATARDQLTGHATS